MNTNAARDFFSEALGYVSDEHAEKLARFRSISTQLFDSMGCEDFLKQYCWVVYAAGFKVDTLRKKFSGLQAAYCDFAIDQLCELSSVDAALAVINNRAKAEAFVNGCRNIRKEGFEAFKARVQSTGMDALQDLPFIGPITQKHLARNVGLLDTAKDDIWLVRLAEKFGASSVDELALYLSDRFGERIGVVDFVLWQFCADNPHECDASPGFQSNCKSSRLCAPNSPSTHGSRKRNATHTKKQTKSEPSKGTFSDEFAMELRFPEHSEFFAPVETALKSKGNFLEAIVVNLKPGGYPREAEVMISATKPKSFTTNWKSTDPSRFSARLRAVAAVLQRMGYTGRFRLSHNNGRVTIQRV